MSLQNPVFKPAVEGVGGRALSWQRSRRLRAHREGKIKAVLATRNETATGVKSDIGGIRAAMEAAGHGAMLFVDGVSSIASMPFDFAGWAWISRWRAARRASCCRRVWRS